jgi:hypothetical protein
VNRLAVAPVAVGFDWDPLLTGEHALAQREGVLDLGVGAGGPDLQG